MEGSFNRNSSLDEINKTMEMGKRLDLTWMDVSLNGDQKSLAMNCLSINRQGVGCIDKRV